MGRPPGFANLMVATGFLYGIAAGGGAGEMIAEWILQGEPSLDLWPLDIRRFAIHHGTRARWFPWQPARPLVLVSVKPFYTVICQPNSQRRLSLSWKHSVNVTRSNACRDLYMTHKTSA